MQFMMAAATGVVHVRSSQSEYQASGEGLERQEHAERPAGFNREVADVDSESEVSGLDYITDNELLIITEDEDRVLELYQDILF